MTESIKPMPGTLLSLHVERRTDNGGIRIVLRTRDYQQTTSCLSPETAAAEFAKFASDPMTAACFLDMFKCSKCNEALSIRMHTAAPASLVCLACENDDLARLARDAGK